MIRFIFAFWNLALKGIVHFEIKIWYLSAYPKDIQDVGVFFSSVDPIFIFLGQTVLVCQSYNGRLSQSARCAHTHVTHRMRAHTQITWTWLCTRGKNYINTVRFLTQTARFVS